MEDMPLRELARKSKVDRGTLRATLEGRRGFSVTSAKAVAQVYGADAIALYVLSQTKALENKAEAGEYPTVLRGVGTVVGELGKLTQEDLKGEGAALADAINQLTALLEGAKAKASTFAKPAGAQDAAETATLSDKILRDAFGAVRRHEKTTKKARDTFGMLIPQGTGSERDGYGKKMG